MFGVELKTVTVSTARLDRLLNEHQVPEIHLLSVDTEGSEVEVLNGIDFARTFVHVACVENNDRKLNLRPYFESRNFHPVAHLGVDQIFINRASPLCTFRSITRIWIAIQLGRIERRLIRHGFHRPDKPRYPFKFIKDR